MTVKYCMIFQLITLIDITQTNARRGHDIFEQKQQQNLMTVIQTLSLRSNATVTKKPKQILDEVEHYGFGEAYQGQHEIWTLNFAYENAPAAILDMLLEDLNYVPFIPNLNETIYTDLPIIVTKDPALKNTIIIQLENDI